MQVVAALARALQLTDAERDHLYRLAGFVPPTDGEISDHIPPGLRRVVNRLSDADRKELSDVLHVEARALQPGAGKGRGAERLALAVTYNPEQGRPRPNSPEVKRYLDNRRPARPGALQVLLVLREAPR